MVWWCVQLLSGNSNAVASLRRKYNKLLGVALTLQNLLDDIATQLERLHACITWQDPSATLLFIAFCACAAMALALMGLPTIMALACFWTVGITLIWLVLNMHAVSCHGLSHVTWHAVTCDSMPGAMELSDSTTSIACRHSCDALSMQVVTDHCVVPICVVMLPFLPRHLTTNSMMVYMSPLLLSL